MGYDCPRCGYSTSILSNFKVHLHRVNPCEDVHNSNLTYDEILKTIEKDRSGFKYLCKDCGTRFPFRQSVYAHKKACKKTLLVETLRQQLEQLSAAPGPSGVQNGQTTNIAGNNNITGNTFNITINNFGSEDLSYIINDTAFLDKILASASAVKDGIPELVRRIHFNKDRPENMNVMCKSLKRGAALLYENGKWMEYDMFHYVIPKLIGTCEKMLVKRYQIINPMNQFDQELSMDELENCAKIAEAITNAKKDVDVIHNVKSLIHNYKAT